jgi:hypothetical protein
MHLRLIDLDKDYETLSAWWVKRGLPAVPKAILPTLGVICSGGNMDIACGWLYLDSGGCLGFVDWVSTNPGICLSPTTNEAVRHVLAFLQEEGVRRGVRNFLTFVAKDTGLQRIMVRDGWQDVKSAAHVQLFKSWPLPQ